jgi:hypothetical protein
VVDKCSSTEPQLPFFVPLIPDFNHEAVVWSLIAEGIECKGGIL